MVLRLNRRTTRALALAVPCGVAAALVAPAALAGALGSRHGRVAIDNLRVRAHVEDGLVTAEMEQVLRNDADQADEAIYDLPLPERATFAGISVWVDEREVTGEVVSRARAEAIYTTVTGSEVATVREARRQASPLQGRSAPADSAQRGRVTLLEPLRVSDPGLLELLDGHTLRLRLAPVPARGTYRVKLRWVEPATVRGGRGRLLVPLAPVAGPDDQVATARRFSASVLVAATDAHRVACPSHADARVDGLAEGVATQVDVSRAEARLDRDLEVTWDLPAATAPTLTVSAARDGRGPGTAMLSLTPWLPADAGRAPRDVVVALDASPSMARHARRAHAAAATLLDALAPTDRFGVVLLDLAGRPWRADLVVATPEARREALAFLRTAAWRHAADPRATMKTIARLRAGTPGPERPLDLVLVTDAGVSRQDALLRAVEAPARGARVRVSALELGADRGVRAPLGRLARATGGVALPGGADASGAATALAEALAAPVLFDPRLTLEGVTLLEVQPTRPPAVLTAGAQVHVFGRYARPGVGRAVLEGTLADGRALRWVLPVTLPERGAHPEVARLWAQAAAEGVEADLARPGLAAGTRAALERDLERVSLAGPVLTRATALLVLESEGMFRSHGLDRRNRDLVGRETAAEAERLEDLERRIEARRREAEQATQVVAMNDAPPRRKVELWGGGDLGGFGGGGGGGAGEPLLLGVAVLAAARSLRKRRAAA
jgi:hypothetical protein